MLERPLFVFAGQSNMMGACALAPNIEYTSKISHEYKHKPKRMGEKSGAFLPVSKNVGEFSYINLRTAYPKGNKDELSELINYEENSFFSPTMCNADSISNKTVSAFSKFSEKTAISGASLPYYFVREWEKNNRHCSFAHLAKGGVSIRYFFDRAMIEEVNKLICEHNAINNTSLPLQSPTTEFECKASKYFCEKITDFFIDSKKRYFNENTSFRPFIWLQGESDSGKMDSIVYKYYLTVLNSVVKKLGCTHFLCIRVGFWGNTEGKEIMCAQEEFCKETPNAHIITRSCSMMPYYNVNESEYYITSPEAKYKNCRDSFLGFDNYHINEKGFLLIAKHMTQNIIHLLNNEPIILENDIVRY